MSGYCLKEVTVSTGGFGTTKVLQLDTSATFPNCNMIMLDKSLYTQLTTLDYASLGITPETITSAFGYGFGAMFSFWVIGYAFRQVVQILRSL